MADYLLNLSELAGENLELYRLVRFEGREAISEPFDYSLEIICSKTPKLSDWIGKPVEFSVMPSRAEERMFAGQIHEATYLEGGMDYRRVALRVRPVFFGTMFARGISFFQDKNSVDILKELTKTLPGLILDNQAGAPPNRAYAVKYDETEFEFLTRLLAQDGIMYYFVHDKSAGKFRHKMVLAKSTAVYKDVSGAGEIEFSLGNERNSISSLQHSYQSYAHRQGYGGAIINKLNTIVEQKGEIPSVWGRSFDSRHYEIFAGVADPGELEKRAKVATERHQQESEQVDGASSIPHLYPTGRIPNAPGEQPALLVLTSVTHFCSDPAVEQGEVGHYGNSFTAIDASRTFRAPVPTARRRAPGPIVAVVSKKEAKEGEVVVDEQWRVPVWITHGHPRATLIWLPVQQAWSQSSYGAQFIPRIGTQVLIDFVYGDPDLPFISGCFYTPSHKYPFELPAQATRSGWRSKTNKNGSIAQEIMFEDKEGGEEIHMYTGRNYRRQIDKDELATINANNTKTVKGDQTLKVVGKRDTTIEKTQTVTVTKKALFESKTEIEIKVGPSTIVLKPSGIDVKAPKITITADTTIDVKAGAKMQQKAPMMQINGDGMVTIQGGLVKIN